MLGSKVINLETPTTRPVINRRRTVRLHVQPLNGLSRHGQLLEISDNWPD
jgi:hypothetical protein